MSRPHWLPDPVGDHAYRLWDGRQWTARVADRGVESDDPLGDRTPPAPSRFGVLLPSLAGVAAAALVVALIALAAMLTKRTPRDTGTFQLHFSDPGEYAIHSVSLHSGETLHARVLVAGGTVRVGLGIPTAVLDAEPGFPLSVVTRQRSGAPQLLARTGNPALDKALGAGAGIGTVEFPGFAGWVAPDHTVVNALQADALRPGSLEPFTATTPGTYDVILIGEQPGAKAVLDVHVTRGDPGTDLGSFGDVVQPDRPPSITRALNDLMRDSVGRSSG